MKEAVINTVVYIHALLSNIRTRILTNIAGALQ